MSAHKVYRAIGLMSGTSLDGVDVAYIKTDGDREIERKIFSSDLYTTSEKEMIRNVLGKRERDLDVDLAEKIVTDKHIAAVRNFINYNDLSGKVDLIGFHGQTVCHAPEDQFTWQIGDAKALAEAVDIHVVSDFRKADIKAGGQGAPLLPLYHKILVGALPKPVALINIGGVSNITWLGKDKMLAFDCGPGNALIDDFMFEKIGENYDKDGELARSGIADEEAIAEWMKHSFFGENPPKSLDRDVWDVSAVHYNLSNEHSAATLTEFTVQAIKAGLKKCPKKPKACYITGGGRLNLYMMERLKKELECEVSTVEDQGWNGDAIEAEGFAYLAVRSKLGLPLSTPETTGVPEAMTGGVVSIP